jgi:hypothetical protein
MFDRKGGEEMETLNQPRSRFGVARALTTKHTGISVMGVGYEWWLIHLDSSRTEPFAIFPGSTKSCSPHLPRPNIIQLRPIPEDPFFSLFIILRYHLLVHYPHAFLSAVLFLSYCLRLSLRVLPSTTNLTNQLP